MVKLPSEAAKRAHPNAVLIVDGGLYGHCPLVAFRRRCINGTYQRGEVDDGRGGGVDLQGAVAEGLGRVGRLVADVVAEQRPVTQVRSRRLKERGRGAFVEAKLGFLNSVN